MTDMRAVAEAPLHACFIFLKAHGDGICEKADLLCIHSTKDLKQSADKVYIILSGRKYLPNRAK